jgi:hypothetical protein
MRKQKETETAWWYAYKAEHSDRHEIERWQNEWETSTGAFGPGGNFFIQGHRGIKLLTEQLATKYVGISDPYTGISNATGDAYRLAKFMDTMGGSGRALLQMSPNFEMYVNQKYAEQTNVVTGIVSDYMKGRVSTRLTTQQIRDAGYSEPDIVTLTATIKNIDSLWNTADTNADSAGGYTTSQGRQIRKTAIEQQNIIIHSTPLNEKFLGDNIASLYGSTYLTKPMWERSDFIRLDKMNPTEREVFQHLTTELDPETGKPRFEGPYLPGAESQLIQNATILGYIPAVKNGRTTWLAQVRIGDSAERGGTGASGIVGTIPVAAPSEAKTIKLSWQQTRKFFKSSFENTPATVEAINGWREGLRAAKVPTWAESLIEEDIRAQAWTQWLAAAAQGRSELRETINVEYGDAPGYSAESKFGAAWKTSLINYGNTLALLSPAFALEWKKYNGNNEMLNSILSWYL